MKFLIVWLIIGLVSSIVATCKFRSSDPVIKKDLILASIGPFFGPIIAVMMALELIARGKK